jgi:ArsR family transcriptional regulator
MHPDDLTRLAALGEVLKALAHPTRLWAVERLVAGERCVCELATEAGVDFSTMSRHLAQLRQAGILVDRRQGKQILYRLQAPCLLSFLACVEEVVEDQRQRRISGADLRQATRATAEFRPSSGGSHELAR